MKDHFSQGSSEYKRYRPGYPAELFACLASLVTRRERAWDCATGSGQAALGLASHFEMVVATDGAARQIQNRSPHPRIAYAVARAEESGLKAGSIDLVTVAQALHWFDFVRFYVEARRVLKSDGAIAAWCYGLFRVSPEIDTIVQGFYTEIVGPFWPPERRFIDERYESIPFPFKEISLPAFSMEAAWTLRHLRGYLHTWSSVGKFRERLGSDPLDSIDGQLATAWGDPESSRTVIWPIHTRVGRI
ncbi:MAG: class I SAM-dependent methyltransferase [Acidobacteriota bacterium]